MVREARVSLVKATSCPGAGGRAAHLLSRSDIRPTILYLEGVQSPKGEDG